MLQRTGHSYLHSVVPWIVMLVALAVGGFLWRLGRAVGRAAVGRAVHGFVVGVVGRLSSVCLVAIFATQEFLKACSRPGIRVGSRGIFGYGGWWSIPAAVCVGLVLAAVFHGARWVLDAVGGRYAGTRSRRAVRVASALRFDGVLVPRLAPLAEGWSGRGPPRYS